MSTAVRHDRIGRRYRTYPTSSGKRITPTDRDILLFEKIHRHGPLSTPYLVAYSSLLRRSKNRAKDRLTDLFNEDNTPHNGPYLTRPLRQFETLDARQNDLVYDLSPQAEKLLKDESLWSEFTPHPNGAWKHRYMVACITASIELATLTTDSVRYIFQDEILERTGTALRFPVTVDGVTKYLIPDGIFGLEYTTPSGATSYRFFFIEADRSTEPNRARQPERKSIERMLREYREFVGKGLYKEALGLSAGILVLTVTTSERRHRNLLALTESLSVSGGSNYLLFRHAPAFGRYFKPPSILTSLFTGPWHRAGRPPFFINSTQSA